MTDSEHEPIGVVLAGGLGRRIGGSKALVELQGRPLISYPLEALRAALSQVAVIAKADTVLPSLPGVTLWIEPQAPRHPVIGIIDALGLAAGRAVFVCAADMPFVTPALVRRVAAADPGGAPAVVPTTGEGALQPLFALYLPAALELLELAGRSPRRPLREQVAAIGPRLLELAASDAEALFNVNSPEDLLHAAALLDRRRL